MIDTNEDALNEAWRIVNDAAGRPPRIVRWARRDGMVIGYRDSGDIGLVMNEHDFDSWALSLARDR